jgi:hypothetical protein
MTHLNTRRVLIPFPTDDEYAAALPADRDAAEILLACRAAGFPNAVITYPEHGLRRLLHAIQHDSDPTLTAQLDAVDAYTDEANKVLDALNERIPFSDPPAESCGIDWLDSGTQEALVRGDCDLTAQQRDYLEWERETRQTRESDRPQ